MSVAFDTHQYVKELQAVGVSEQQAEIQVKMFNELQESYLKDLANKEDIKDLRQETKEVETSLTQQIKELETSLTQQIKELETSLKQEIRELELKTNAQLLLLKWMNGLMLAGVASLVIKTFFA